MQRPRLVLFGSGSPLSCMTFSALSKDSCDILAVVVPRRPRRNLLRRLLRPSVDPASPLRRLAEAHRIPVVEFDQAISLREARPDLFCVASFPHRLPRALLDIPAKGTLNIHTSLLPRHRGQDPIFWAYFCDERETGITVHWMDEGMDTGPIAAQRTVALPRGTSGRDLYMKLAEEGSAALMEVVRDVARGSAAAIPQDESAATAEPPPSRGTWRIDFANWPAERLWHFMQGTAHLRLPIVDHAGRAHLISHVISFRQDAAETDPGTVTSSGERIRIHTRDGWVEAAPRPALERWRFRLRRLAAAL